MKHGDSVVLKNGKSLLYVMVHPQDGACHIGFDVTEGRSDNGPDYIDFEWSEVSLINDKPRPITMLERQNFVIPILTGFDAGYVTTRKNEIEAAMQRGKRGWDAVDEAIRRTDGTSDGVR